MLLDNTEKIYQNPHQFKGLVAAGLESSGADFVEQMQFIRRERQRGKRWSASGILILLELDSKKNEVIIVLNKRSSYVQQAGDLCCPGGGSDRNWDRFLARLLGWRVLPSSRSKPFSKLLQLPKEEKDIFLFLLANVLRESWEEMRLPPWKMDYLGCLPTHMMQNFTRIIFPVVGMARRPWRPRPNWEVERIVRLPLHLFFDTDNYALCRVSSETSASQRWGRDDLTLPCLVFSDNGHEEILWGATFRILMGFVASVFKIPVDRIHPTREIQKTLPSYYYTGRQRNK